MRTKRRARPSNPAWVTYERSYLVTLGLAFVGLPGFVWTKQRDTFAEWAAWEYFILLGLPVLGLIVIGVGLLASRNRIEKWADGASRHEASVVLMIIAFPVFLVMSLFERRN